MNISWIYAQLRRIKSNSNRVVKEGELTVIAELLSYLNKVTSTDYSNSYILVQCVTVHQNLCGVHSVGNYSCVIFVAMEGKGQCAPLVAFSWKLTCFRPLSAKRIVSVWRAGLLKQSSLASVYKTYLARNSKRAINVEKSERARCLLFSRHFTTWILLPLSVWLIIVDNAVFDGLQAFNKLTQGRGVLLCLRGRTPVKWARLRSPVCPPNTSYSFILDFNQVCETSSFN